MTERRNGRQRARREVSAGGVVYRQHGDRVDVLLIRDRYRHWGFPKGHLEGDETPAEAALREVEEETALSKLRLGTELGVIDWHFRFRGDLIHKYCHFFLVESPEGDPAPQREEGIHECRWLPFSEAVRTISYENARGVLLRAAQELGCAVEQ
jgi:8-oxo-dGTP pyrophosphatase MutT (NUDIX family)